MRTRKIWLLAGISLALVGCGRTVYEIEMTPVENGLERRVTVFVETEDGSVKRASYDDLGRLDRVYALRESGRAEIKQSFSGTFGDELPDDVGNFGRFVHYPSTLGTLYTYTERFGQGIDPVTALATSQEAAEHLGKIAADLMRVQMKAKGWTEGPNRFLNESLSHDAKNLSLVWNMNAGIRSGDPEEVLQAGITALHYLIEYGYMDMRVLSLVLVSDDLETEDSTDRFVSSFFMSCANKLEADGVWLRIGSTSELEHAWEMYTSEPRNAIEAADQFLDEVSEFAAGELESSTPEDILVSLVLTAFPFSFDLFGSNPRATIRMASSAEPLITNGKWDSETSQVLWTMYLEEDSHPSALRWQMAFSIWVEPDRATQNRLFGGVVLNEQALAHFCRLESEMGPDDQAAWKSFILDLAATEDPVRMIKAHLRDPEFFTDQQRTLARLLKDVLQKSE